MQKDIKNKYYNEKKYIKLYRYNYIFICFLNEKIKRLLKCHEFEKNYMSMSVYL